MENIQTTNTGVLTEREILNEQASFMVKVYTWMTYALLVTALTALWVASERDLMISMFSSTIVQIGLFLGMLGLVGFLVVRIHKMSVVTAISVFTAFSIIVGFVLSSIFVVYTIGSLASTFFITSGMFAAMSIYGFVTKKDLTKWGSLLFMGLIGVIIAGFVNMFIESSALYWIQTIIGIIVFVGLIAYDTQKIKEMNIIGNAGSDEDRKESIIGALTLYLDFINLFLFLLRIFGDRD